MLVMLGFSKFCSCLLALWFDSGVVETSLFYFLCFVIVFLVNFCAVLGESANGLNHGLYFFIYFPFCLSCIIIRNISALFKLVFILPALALFLIFCNVLCLKHFMH